MERKYIFTKNQELRTSRGYNGEMGLRPSEPYSITHVIEVKLPYPPTPNLRVEVAPNHIITVDPSKVLPKKSADELYVPYQLGEFVGPRLPPDTWELALYDVKSLVESNGTDYLICPNEALAVALEAAGLKVKRPTQSVSA